MRRIPLQLTTMFAAATIFAAQTAPPICLCSATAAGLPSCKDSCCGEGSQDAASGATDCTCSATSRLILAPASEKSQRVDVPSTSNLILPVAAWTENLGLHGVDWQTAFDLVAASNPPLRLHALFSVWRN
jgi:hypothetical protein